MTINARLIEFEELKEVVIATSIKNVPKLKKAKETKRNASLMSFT